MVVTSYRSKFKIHSSERDEFLGPNILIMKVIRFLYSYYAPFTQHYIFLIKISGSLNFIFLFQIFSELNICFLISTTNAQWLYYTSLVFRSA